MKNVEQTILWHQSSFSIILQTINYWKQSLSFSHQ